MALTRPRSWQLLDSDYKDSCRAATTDPVNLSAAPNNIDNVPLAKRDRILVKNQSTASQNGIYYVQTLGTGSNGVWVRAADFASSENISSGLQVSIEEGDVNGDKTYQLTTDNPIILNTTSLVFELASGGGGGGSQTLDDVTDLGNTTTNGITVGNLTVDNIFIDTNTISSTNTNGNINLTPNGSGVILANANITAPVFISNVSTGTAPFTVTSTTQVANLNVATAGTATTAGTVTTAAQPNITSVGTLSSLSVSGTVTSNKLQTNENSDSENIGVGDDAWIGDMNTANTLRIKGKQDATAGYISFGSSDVTALGRVGTGPLTYGGNTIWHAGNDGVGSGLAADTAGTVITAAQPNITSVGNLTIANIDNIQIDGNTISSTNANGNIDITPNGTGNINLNDPVQATSTIQATRFISNIATGTAPFTVTSTTQVANLNVATAGSATTAGTVTTAAQPNITSVGTLTSLTLSGDVTLNAQSDLRFADSDSSNWVAFQAPTTITSNVTWTLPATDGSNGNALLTYGNGVLYWGAAGGGGASVTTSTTAPVGPSDGNLWFDEDDGAIYIYYEDGTSNQWVEIGQNTFVSPLTIDNITISGSTISTLTNANLNLSPNGTGNVILSALSGTAVVYTSSNKELRTSTNLTFNGTNLTLTGNANITSSARIGNITLSGNTITFNDSSTQTTAGITTAKAFALITIFG